MNLQTAIDFAGGTPAKLGAAIGVTRQAVENWLKPADAKSSTNPSIKSAVKIEKLTGGLVTVEQLRPDAYE